MKIKSPVAPLLVIRKLHFFFVWPQRTHSWKWILSHHTHTHTSYPIICILVIHVVSQFPIPMSTHPFLLLSVFFYSYSIIMFNFNVILSNQCPIFCYMCDLHIAKP